MMQDRLKNYTILIKRNELSPFEHLKISLLLVDGHQLVIVI